VKRTHVAAVAALIVLATPALAGCFNGPGATTTTQAGMNSGNGVEADQGAIHIEGTTVVVGPDGGSATLVVRLVNVGPETDALTYATIDGTPANIITADDSVDAGSAVELLPGSSTGFGYESDHYITLATGFEAGVSTYVPVELGFRNAGLAQLQVLTVPQAGMYANVVGAP
jgi:hypothetical protein